MQSAIKVCNGSSPIKWACRNSFGVLDIFIHRWSVFVCLHGFMSARSSPERLNELFPCVQRKWQCELVNKIDHGRKRETPLIVRGN